MPLTAKGRKILHAMQQEYGPQKGKAVFHAALNKGLITGIEGSRRPRRLRETPSRREPAG
jgi:hypothetical protein